MRLRTALLLELFHSVSLVVAVNVMYSVPEESRPGTLIGNIPNSISLAKLVSQASLPYMKYSFLSNDANLRKYFSLNDKTGDLMLSSTQILDREVICQFDVTCILELQIAIQSTHTQFFRKVLVSIDVVDMNDHSPHFKENFTVLTISESIQIPTTLPLPSAIDQDTGANNSLQGYEIFPKDTPFDLLYSKSNPNLMLRVSRDLDHETRDFYSFRIIARDGGSPSREGILNVDVVVEDVNDNAPKFEQENYAKVVDETVSQGSLLFTLTATDADSGKNGQVRYRLSPQQPASVLSMFAVDEILGDLRLIGDFQSADTELYRIDVEASDMADQPLTARTTASIQVDDTINSRPKLVISYLSTHNFSSISEHANLGVAVAHVLVKDTDRGPNGVVQCHLTTQEYFELQNYDVKEYNVIVARPLDRESLHVHNITVQCTDSGIPPLSVSESIQVKITDENDNTPEFNDHSYMVEIRENNEVDKEILKVTAVDADDPNTNNGRITYSLQDTANGEFLINPDTGVIKATSSFDYEVKRQINFTVVAEDNGNPRRLTKASVSVNIIDENDQVPYFTQSRFTIAVSEYARPGDLIGEIKAFDFEQGENGQFEIFPIPGSGKGKRNQRHSFPDNQNDKETSLSDYEEIIDDAFPFIVQPNGSLYLESEVDHEKLTSFQFQVRVTDKGDPPLSDTATVVVGVRDENDNAPYIVHPNMSDYWFPALVGSDAPQAVMDVEATDRDSGRNGFLVYTITARNDSGRFEVDVDGRLKRTRVLGGKDAGTYKLSVVVMDSGSPPLSDIRTFFIHVAGSNETLGKTGPLNDRYIIITLTLVCVTILLSVTIVLIIIIMRRLDKRRKNSRVGAPRGPIHIHNSRVVSTYVEPSKKEKVKSENDENEFKLDGNGNANDNKKNDSHFGFSSTLSGSLNKNNMADNGYKFTHMTRLDLPTAASRDEERDVLTMQLHPGLCRVYQESQVATRTLEDRASNSSGDTITSDSGRGASDEDFNASNVAAEDFVDGSAGDNDERLQSYNNNSGQIFSTKSSVKQPIRPNHRKHVTFKDAKQLPGHVGDLSERPSSRGSDATSDNFNSSATTGCGQHQSMSSFGGINSGGADNRDVNISSSNDNSYLHLDNNNFSSFRENNVKMSPRKTLSTFNYANKINRDYPGHQVFPST